MDGNLSENTKAVTSSAGFGHVTLTAAVAAFRHELNGEMMRLFRSLPESTHTDAMVFFMQHFRTPFFPEFDYFQNYHAPAWSIIHWLDRMYSEHGSLSPEDRRHARVAHAMALFLHPLDDHLNDGQLPATHLHLLLRSQAWRRMNAALEGLAMGVTGGPLILQGFLDDYYASIGSPPAIATLDGYCAHFRRQMATWMCVPVLMAVKIMPDDDFRAVLQTAYGSFGVAWRLLDDLQDLETDMTSGSRSAVYFGLPAEIRQLWDQNPLNENRARYDKILDAVHRGGVLETIRERIGRELTSAASTLDAIRLAGLADELRCLAGPFADEPATA